MVMTISQFGYFVAAGAGVVAAYYWPRVYAAVKAKFTAKVVQVEAEVKAKI
jgi:hypothetical protein